MLLVLAAVMGYLFGTLAVPRARAVVRALLSGVAKGSGQTFAIHHIGATTLDSIRQEVPEHWGIILILSDPVTDVASVSHNVSSSKRVAAYLAILVEDPTWQHGAPEDEPIRRN